MNKQLLQAGFSEMKFNTGELTLNYAVGPNNGPALLFIPAQMGIWETYAPNMLALAPHFQIYAIDVRGHGGSDWATGDYSWDSAGRDLRAFVQKAIGRKTIVSGNSSGGILALWLAANAPEWVSGLILEDAPVFSVEMPRFRDEDRFVYAGLKHLVGSIGDVDNRDLADYFRGQTLPVNQGRREKRVPDWVADMFSYFIKRHQAEHPGRLVDIPYFPGSLRARCSSHFHSSTQILRAPSSTAAFTLG